jgi:hypothetical protein
MLPVRDTEKPCIFSENMVYYSLYVKKSEKMEAIGIMTNQEEISRRREQNPLLKRLYR